MKHESEQDGMNGQRRPPLTNSASGCLTNVERIAYYCPRICFLACFDIFQQSHQSEPRSLGTKHPDDLRGHFSDVSLAYSLDPLCRPWLVLTYMYVCMYVGAPGEATSCRVAKLPGGAGFKFSTPSLQPSPFRGATPENGSSLCVQRRIKHG